METNVNLSKVVDSLGFCVLNLQVLLEKTKIKKMKYVLELNVFQQSLYFPVFDWYSLIKRQKLYFLI